MLSETKLQIKKFNSKTIHVLMNTQNLNYDT